MTAGVAKPGWVLAATWVTGELEGNFRTMMTSCWAWSVNIKGLCRRRYCWVDRQNPSKQREDRERERIREKKRKIMLKQAASQSVMFRVLYNCAMTDLLCLWHMTLEPFIPALGTEPWASNMLSKALPLSYIPSSCWYFWWLKWDALMKHVNSLQVWAGEMVQ